MTRRSLDQVEAVALQAALSLIDDMDQEMDWIFGRDSPTEDDGGSNGSSKQEEEDDDEQAVAGAAKRPVRKRKRNRRRDEIVYLREKVEELERVLEETKERIASAKGIDRNEVEVITIWEELALRQQRGREATEVENAKLREMLESQVQVGRELMLFLQRQPREEDIPGVRALKRLQIAPVNVDEFTYTELRKRLDAQFAQTETVFAADPEWTTRRSFRSVRLREDDSETAVIEIHTAWVVPFDLALVTDVFARRAERVSIESQCPHFETLDEVDGVLVSLFTGVAQNSSGDATTVKGRIVTRRYMETDQDKAVVVSELTVEPTNASTSPFAMYAVNSNGWIRLVPYKPDGVDITSQTTRHLTHIQWFRRVRVIPRCSTTTQQRRCVGAFTELVLSHIAQDVEQSQQVIEDLLLQGTREPVSSHTSHNFSSSTSSSPAPAKAPLQVVTPPRRAVSTDDEEGKTAIV